MAKKIIKSQARVFSDSFKMETETVFHKDGTIKTFPCAYELGQQITCTGGTVVMKAKVTVDADGNTSVMPYQQDSGERYHRLMKTEHGAVLETKQNIIVKLAFKKRLGRFVIADMLEDEIDDMIEFIESSPLPASPRGEVRSY